MPEIGQGLRRQQLGQHRDELLPFSAATYSATSTCSATCAVLILALAGISSALARLPATAAITTATAAVVTAAITTATAAVATAVATCALAAAATAPALPVCHVLAPLRELR